MNNPVTLSAVSAAVVALVAQTTAQYTSGAIASCADFDCPTDGPAGPRSWTFAGSTYENAGMVPFEAPFTESDLTWTLAQSEEVEGTAVNDPDAEITASKDFYLGTPQGLDLSDTGYYGCALFFLDSNATFAPPPVGQGPIPPGECPSVIGQDCVDALLQQAANQPKSDLSSSQDLCDALVSDIESSVPDACSSVTNQSSWGQVEARIITGGDAPQSLSRPQNLTSEAWPVIPKSYDLAPVLDSSDRFPVASRRVILGSDPYDDTAIGVFSYYQAIPVLTVFRPEDSTDDQAGSVTSNSNVRCLMAPEVAFNNTYFPESPENGAPGLADGSVIALASAAFFAVWTIAL